MRSRKKSAAVKAKVEEEEIFDNFKIKLTELKPIVREKAIDLARQMMENGIIKEQALTKGIQEAESWFLESHG